MQEPLVKPLGQEDPLEDSMATYSSIFDWRIPWTEEPGMLQSKRSPRNARLKNLSAAHTHTHAYTRVHTHTHTHTHAYTRVHTHMHTHTQHRVKTNNYKIILCKLMLVLFT